MDVMIEVVLDHCVSAGEVVVPLYNLYIERLCTPRKDSRKNSMKLFLLDVEPPTEVEENLNLVIQQVIHVSSVLLAVLPVLGELRDLASIKFVVARPSWRQCLVGIILHMG